MDLDFGPEFLFGAATAAHQVEGGCRNNQWWEWEQTPGHVRDGSTSEIACDHYRRFRDDFALAGSLGMQAQRLSIEWSRVEPEPGVFDEAEADHYRAVCDAVRANGMVPTVTLHHFTNPLWAERRGGWENPDIAAWLARFAAWAVRALGERVELWWTVNEPMVLPALGYLLGIHPPGVRDAARAVAVARNVLLAHGAMYRAMKDVSAVAIRVGPVLQMPLIEPLDPASDADRSAAEQQDFLFNQYFLEGLTRGVVAAPIGGDEAVPGLAGSYDVVGLNYYARMLVSGADAPSTGPGSAPSPAAPPRPLGGHRRPSEPPPFVDQMGWEIHPEGLRLQLVRLSALGAPLYVTESGMATRDERARCAHLLVHLREVHRAMRAGADVRGFFYWTLLDNFEWAEGYSRTFGLIEVDRRAGLARRPREAAYLYRDIALGRRITPVMLERHGVLAG